MEILLVRHGLPERVETKDGTPADPPLSERGRAQARRTAEWLAEQKIDAVYSSPMRRARQTAEPIGEAMQLAIEVAEGVAEFDRNSKSYVPLEVLKREDPEQWRRLVAGGWDFDCQSPNLSVPRVPKFMANDLMRVLRPFFV